MQPQNLRFLTMPELVREQRKGTLILDTRAAERFAALHIKGAMQLSLLGRFAVWAAILIKPDQKLLLVVETIQDAEEAHNRLTRVGNGRVVGYSLANETEWREQGVELASITIEQCANIGHDCRSFQLVDVRSRAEWLKGHLPGAISIPLLDLGSREPLVDPSKSTLVYCHEGYRATTAASILLRKGAGDIGILIDGIEGWLASGLPLEMPEATKV